MNIALLIFPLLMDILPLKSLCIITIISICSPHVILVVVGRGGYFNIFGIWNKSFLSDQFWNLICGLLVWVTTRFIFLWPALYLDMALLVTLVTSHIWLYGWPSSRATNISTTVDLEVNLLQSLVGQMINGHSVFLWKWRLFLRIFFAGSRFPPIWIDKVAVFACSLLYKGLIGYELLLWYDIHVIHTKFLDTLRNLLVLLNIPKTKSRVRSILKDVSDVP